MGIIKEPTGVDLNISPIPLTDEDRQALKAIIARYKSTGEIPKLVRKVKSKKGKKRPVSAGIKRTQPGAKYARKS